MPVPGEGISGQPAVTVARLKKRSEFLKVSAANRKWVAPGVIVQALPRGENDPIRLGFTVSKKVGNAVMRNRARRRLRAAAAAIVPSSGVTGFDLVLIGRGATLTRPYADLCRDLGWAVRRLCAGETRPTAKS